MLSGRKSKVRDLSGRRLRKSFSMSVFLFGRRAAAASRLERRSRQAPEKGLLMRIHSTENSEEPFFFTLFSLFVVQFFLVAAFRAVQSVVQFCLVAAHAGISTISSLMGGGTASPCLIRLAR